MAEEERQEESPAPEAEVEEEKAAPELRACVFKISGIEFSVPLEFLVEIVEVEEVFFLPLVPDYISGMIHYRGRAVPLIDMGALHDRPKKQNLKGSSAIVTEYAGELIGFASDELPRLTEEFQGEIIEMGEFFDAYRVR